MVYIVLGIGLLIALATRLADALLTVRRAAQADRRLVQHQQPLGERDSQPAISGRNNVTSTTLDNTNTLVITTYVVAPADQQRIMDRLTVLYAQVIRELPGFASTHIYKSSDGARLVTYSRWESQEAFDAILRDDAVCRAFVAIASSATPDPRYYELASVITAVPDSAAPS